MESSAPLRIILKRAPGNVKLQAAITNVSGRDVEFLQKDPLTDYSFDVTDEHGAAVPLSAAGRQYFSPSRIRAHFRILKKLHPGQTAVDTLSIGDLFAFQRPGRYLITVHRESTTSNTLAVNLK